MNDLIINGVQVIFPLGVEIKTSLAGSDKFPYDKVIFELDARSPETILNEDTKDDIPF
jgi:hypothetical protein